MRTVAAIRRAMTTQASPPPMIRAPPWMSRKTGWSGASLTPSGVRTSTRTPSTEVSSTVDAGTGGWAPTTAISISFAVAIVSRHASMSVWSGSVPPASPKRSLMARKAWASALIVLGTGMYRVTSVPAGAVSS